MKYMTKQEYYEHLCRIGLPNLIAASMAGQSDRLARTTATDSMRGEVYGFGSWKLTREGFDFWSDFVDCLI